MRMFEVSGCDAKIVKPNMALGSWVIQNKPFAVINASLYDFASRIPIGTIIEDGKLVHNDGNGFGFGIFDGKPRFGKPWDRAWTDYITGYNSPVQNGVYVEPSFTDTYVFNCRLARIGIGQCGTHLLVVTDEYVTLKEFAQNAIANGIDTLVNLDGGGSRHLYLAGQAIYTSPRVPYNAIAFYKKDICEYCTDDGRCRKWEAQ